MGCEAKSLDRVSQHRARSSAADTPVHLSSSLHRVLRLQQSVGNRAVQRLIQRPDLQDRLSLNVTGYSPNASRLALRAAEESSDTPTEEQKRAALAAAARAERVASQAAAVGKAEIDKSNQNQTKENRLKQAGKQRAEASSSAAEQAKRKGKKKTKAAGRSGRRRAPGRSTAAPAASRSGRAPSSPAEDPGFQKVVKRVGGAARQQRSHKTPEEKAAEAQAAAVAPGEEITGRAQGNKAAEIEHAQAPPFNAAAFKEQLLKRIADLAPKTLSEADNFKSDDRLGSVKDDMQGKVATEKTASKEPLEKKASEPPDPATVEPKRVTPIPPPAPGAPPPAVGAADAAPKPKTKQEIEQPIRENTAGIGDELAKENITEEQLAKSNEPTFQSALSAKKQAEAHAATAPGQYRKAEQGTVSGAARQAVAVAGAGTRTMNAARTDAFGKVHGVQRQSKSKDEAARLKVGQDIDRIYQETSAEVGKILTELDGKVESAFDEGASAAKQVFEDYVDAQMEAYKERRYGGWFGWARWAKDKLLGMPDEVNVFYERGRNLYIRKMDAVIDNVVAIIGKELTAARAKVAEGRRKITEYLANLPEDLKKVGGEAAENALTMFDSLEEQVNSKQESLLDTLANKYQENLKAIDARIEELKAANRGLVAKAIDAVKAVVNAIIEIKNFLKTVLSKIANVISLILDDPIGFLGNLISALKQGFTNFAENIWDHIKGGFISWLTGAMGSVRLVMPEDIFSVKGMFSILLQVLGIGWDYIRAKAVKLLGAPAVRVLEGTFTVFQILMKEGPAGLWEFAKEKFTDLKNALVDQIQDMVITQVIKAGIKWLIGLLNPVSAFIKAAMAIYEIVKFFIEKARQIGEFISAVIDAVADVARGSIGGAAKKVEDALIRAIPLIIGFLASLLGLSGLAGKVQKLFTTLRSRVDAFIDGLILKARQFVKKAAGAAKATVARVVEWWRMRKVFRTEDGTHSLYFRGGTPDGPLVVASAERTVDELLAAGGQFEKSVLASGDRRRATALQQARVAHSEVKKAQSQLRRNPKNADALRTLRTEFNTLGGRLTVLGVSVVSPADLPDTTIVHSANGDRAGKVTAEPLSRKGSGGSRPDPGIVGWNHVQYLGTGDWERVHLISEQFHGPGKFWNLIPARKTDNAWMREGPEAAIKTMLKRNAVLSFSVTVNGYHRLKNPDTGEAIHGFPTSLSITLSTMKKTGNAWVRDVALSPFPTKTLAAPPLTDGRGVDLRFANYHAVHNLGIPPGVAHAVREVKPSQGFKDENDFRAKMRARYESLAPPHNVNFDKVYWPLFRTLIKAKKAHF